MASNQPPAIKVDTSKDGFKHNLHDKDDGSGSEYSVTLTPSRRSNESTPAASLYDKVDSEHPTTSAAAASTAPPQVFSLFHTASHLDLRIVPGDKSTKDVKPETDATLFVTNSLFKPGSADVTLSAGPSAGGAVLGEVRFRFEFGTFHVGIGDTRAGGRDVRWEDMKRHGAFKTKLWRFEWPVGEEKHTFSWKRTHDAGLGANWSLRNKKLVDERDGSVMAVYLQNRFKSWKKMGKLVVYKDLGDDWEMMVLLTCLGVVEKQRRRRRAAMMSSGGGGGPW